MAQRNIYNNINIHPKKSQTTTKPILTNTTRLTILNTVSAAVLKLDATGDGVAPVTIRAV